jgi:hypothetical protein
MRATNFSVRSGIYFVVGGAQLDMHNDYDFAAFSVGGRDRRRGRNGHPASRTARGRASSTIDGRRWRTVSVFLLGAACLPVSNALEFPSLPPGLAAAVWPWAPALFVGLASIVMSLLIPSVSTAFPLGASSYFVVVAFSGYWIVELIMAGAVLFAGLAGEALVRVLRRLRGSHSTLQESRTE